MLCHVWTALEAKQEVNGCKSKGAWAKKCGVTTRYCQYLVRDGSRKRDNKNANPVRVVTLKTGMLIKISGVTYRIPAGTNHPVHAIKKHHKDGTKDVTLRGLEMVGMDVESETKPAPKKSTKTEVIHAIYQTRSGSCDSTHCGLDADKVRTAGFDADDIPIETGITCKLCLRKNHGAVPSQPTEKQPAPKPLELVEGKLYAVSLSTLNFVKHEEAL
jgi:hypothetical protein